MFTKPILSGKAPEDLSKLSYPLLASPKLDGIRCMIRDGVAVSRNFKPIPNQFVQSSLKGLPDGLDGELLLSDTTAPFKEVSSAIMSRAGEPDFRFEVFDYIGHGSGPEVAFVERLHNAQRAINLWAGPLHVAARRVAVVPHYEVTDAQNLQELHDRFSAGGFEGTMVRRPLGPYKFGRSTAREQILLKLKTWDDEEAEVIGLVERMHNANEATRNEAGKIERSTSKKGLVPMGTMGALVCRFEDGVEFEVGTGFSDEERQQLWELWQNTADNPFVRDRLTVRYQPPPGGRPAGVAPRFPVFKGWRKDL